MKKKNNINILENINFVIKDNRSSLNVENIKNSETCIKNNTEDDLSDVFSDDFQYDFSDEKPRKSNKIKSSEIDDFSDDFFCDLSNEQPKKRNRLDLSLLDIFSDEFPDEIPKKSNIDMKSYSENLNNNQLKEYSKYLKKEIDSIKKDINKSSIYDDFLGDFFNE